MTEREKDIYSIIEKNPFISQNEIAEILGITRSSVSVYLNTMIKKKIILGRGYLLNTESYPVIIGPAHIDIFSQCLDTLSYSHVYHSEENAVTYGGASKNIAEYLIRLGIPTQAIFVVASDFYGSNFLKDCQNHGINVNGSVIVEGETTPFYIDIVDKEYNRIVSTFAANDLASKITPEHLHSQYIMLDHANYFVINDNLSYESVEYLVSTFTEKRMYFFSTNLEFTYKFSKILKRFTFVMIPFHIAAGIINMPSSNSDCAGEEEVQKLARSLKALGIAHALIPYNFNQFYYFDDSCDIIYTFTPGGEMHQREYPYYRDACMAAFLYCVEQQMTIQQQLKYLGAARIIASNSLRIFQPAYSLGILEDEMAGMVDDYKYFPS